jgi:hypothetical protein
MHGMRESKNKVILLSSEGCIGEDADLGFEILAALLDSLPGREDSPQAIICWNTAVNLLAKGSPLLRQLNALEENGTKILAGQLCVRELGLTDKIAVGKPVAIGELLDVMLHSDVISL